MSEIHEHWARACSTEQLNALLADRDRLVTEGKPVPTGLAEALEREKDRRLSDPNHPDFRPTFF